MEKDVGEWQSLSHHVQRPVPALVSSQVFEHWVAVLVSTTKTRIASNEGEAHQTQQQQVDPNASSNHKELKLDDQRIKARPRGLLSHSQVRLYQELMVARIHRLPH